ncbi:Uncharacterised protein [BD1-7 clade bacterium]|uniref:Peptidase S54 rhomboid domain-containing protein n=1 Tax=BD1-7 clade bacterium TaxID=2029982 RepID=A0A5S9QB08_9GAMM|nr:Uncharacterised protein [BD1-7 clade bacterium]CAA0115543.1 Uncharacterised protein [BD1-7 clade bacterium]
MNQPSEEIKRHTKAVLAIYIALVLICVMTQITDGREWASYNKTLIEHGQWWRILTAHFVHLDWKHYLLNMSGAALCLFVFRHDIKPIHWPISAILISIFSSLCMLTFAFDYSSYVGFSDTLYGWIFIGALAMLPKEPKLALIVMAIFGGRVTYENIVSHSLIDSFMNEGKVAVESHLFGTIGGIIYSLFFNKELRHFLKHRVWRMSDSDPDQKS